MPSNKTNTPSHQIDQTIVTMSQERVRRKKKKGENE